MQALVRLENDRGVARIVLNRAEKRNALSRLLIEELAEAVAAAGDDDSVRLVILAAEGPVFCAGMDLAEMKERAEQPISTELWQHDTRLYRDLVVSLFQLPMPTLAVVQGPALAGGVGLAAACDFLLAADGASFSLPEPKRGISPAVVAPLLLYRLGAGPATKMLLSGQTTSADEALRIGLCHQVVPKHELRDCQRDWIDSVLACAPAALARTKQFVIDCAADSLLAQLESGRRVSAEARAAPEAGEGLAAFLEKRRPGWHSQSAASSGD